MRTVSVTVSAVQPVSTEGGEKFPCTCHPANSLDTSAEADIRRLEEEDQDLCRIIQHLSESSAKPASEKEAATSPVIRNYRAQ